MRWYERKKPFDGQIRTKKRFLFFPKKIYVEWRWLEIATWEEKYVLVRRSGLWGSYTRMQWRKSAWVNTKQINPQLMENNIRKH